MKQARIFQINVSDGGVPKLPVRSAKVTGSGVSGDRQKDLKHHGGPRQKVCLFSLERIIDLQQEGHPIYPGSTGENLTLSGLDWNEVLPGAHIRLGDGVIVEIAGYTTPCSKIAESFSEGQFGRMLQDEYPGWSRVYARVVTPGLIQVGGGLSHEDSILQAGSGPTA